MEKINSIHQLHLYAQVKQVVADILADRSQGRRKAAEELTELLDMHVSEKLVRNYREKMTGLGRPLVQAVENMPQTGTTRSRDDYWYARGGQLSSAVSIPTLKVVPKAVSKKPKTIVIMPDVQAPLHDTKLVDKFIRFLGDYQPDELAQVGDFTDSTEISRWVRGKKGEYAGDLQGGFDTAREILADIRDVFDGRFRIVRSNHDDRLELYIENCAPGFSNLRALSIEGLAGFDEFDVEFIRDEVVVLNEGSDKPWVMAHGDEGSLSPIAGRTAFGLAKNKFGANVVCGHTHRAGLTSESTGFNGKIRDTRFGLEVGHFMDLSKADYLKKKGVAANWQQAFGILTVHGDDVYPQLITVVDGSFSVEGKLY